MCLVGASKLGIPSDPAFVGVDFAFGAPPGSDFGLPFRSSALGSDFNLSGTFLAPSVGSAGSSDIVFLYREGPSGLQFVRKVRFPSIPL